MATKPETQFRKKVRADLTRLVELGLPIFFEAVQQRGIRGSADYHICLDGNFMALELKNEDGIVSLLQRAKLKRVSRAGGMGIVADQHSWPAVFQMFLDLLGVEDGSGNDYPTAS